MKRLFTLLAVLSIFLVGCTKNFIDQENPIRPTNEHLPDLVAAFADVETRTYVENDKYLRWHEDDRLTAFYGNTLNRQYKFNGNTGDNSGTFSLVPSGELGTGNSFDCIYALYPYNKDAMISDEGIISLTLPAVQSYAENSFGKGANSMVAVTESAEDTYLSFKNACGYLKLKLYSTKGANIKSITLEGNNGEKIAGAATATIEFGEAPVLNMSDDATTSIVLDCGDGVNLGTNDETATTFWIALPETTFSKGITVLVTDKDGTVYGVSTDKSVVVERNVIQPMAAIEITLPQGEVSASIPNNEIWYTTTNAKVVMPNAIDIFGAKFLSNSYITTIVRNQDGTAKGIIRFDSDITKIGANAFSDCQTLFTVTLPASIVEIEDNAFKGCSALVALKCNSQTPPTLGDNAFEQCSKGFSIYVSEQATEDYQNSWKSYSSIINSGEIEDTEVEWTTPDDPTVIYYKTDDGYALDPYTAEGYGANLVSNEYNAATGEGVLRFDGNVTALPENAFAACVNLTHMRVPTAVLTIGTKAFYGCTYMKELTIPSSVTKVGENAFDNCTGKLTIHCNVFAGMFRYSKFTELVVEEGATSVERLAFAYNTSLRKVKIGKGVITIGSEAFRECSALSDVEIGPWVKEIQGLAFYNCTSLRAITIPGSVVAVKNSAFGRCDGLERVDIQDLNPWWNIKFDNAEANPLYCGHNLYLNEKLVTEVTIPANKTTVPAYILAGASCIEKITVMDGVTSFGNEAFYKCSGLKEIILPNSVTSLYGYLFAETGIESFKVPNGVTVLPHSLFKQCENLVSVEIHDNITEIGSGCFRSCSSLKSIEIPNKVLKIDSYTFSGCTAMEEVKIGSRVSEIGDFAFEKCSSLKSIVIPKGVSKINWSTFEDCTNLGTVSLLGNITSIEREAFKGCTNLQSINFPSTLTAILNEAFYNCESLEQAILPQGLKTIDSNVFKNCKSLRYIEIPEGITNINYLEQCSSLESVKLPSTITKLTSSAFSGCSSLKSIDLSYITAVESSVFYGCSSLESVKIPEGITTITYSMFYNCSSLKSVELPQSIKKFDKYAFQGCSALESITFPEGVEDIGQQAFCYCSSLTTITIPTSVTSIGDSAFLCCPLTSVYCKRVTPPSLLGKWVFMRDKQGSTYYPMNGKIYVPSGSENAYKNTANWSVYSNIITGYDF